MKKTTHSTLSQVAKTAGVGTTTVSRVINGGDRVSPKTLARVNRAIASLGYVPNEAARTLRGQRSKIVGLLVPSIADPFFSSCAEAVQAVANANDSLLVIAANSNNVDTEAKNLKELIRHRVDGLIIVPADPDSAALRTVLGRIAVPVVALDRPIAGMSLVSVLSDNEVGAWMATRHLIEHGRKRILCLTGETELYTIQQRLDGYRRAIQEAGLKPLIESSIVDYQSTQAALGRLLKSKTPPDAIFATKNSTSIWAFEALQKFGISIPDTVALLGFDDFELASTLRPSISVIEQPIEELGRRAAIALFDQLSGEQPSTGRGSSKRAIQVKLGTRLIPRRSCGCSELMPGFTN